MLNIYKKIILWCLTALLWRDLRLLNGQRTSYLHFNLIHHFVITNGLIWHWSFDPLLSLIMCYLEELVSIKHGSKLEWNLVSKIHQISATKSEIIWGLTWLQDHFPFWIRLYTSITDPVALDFNSWSNWIVSFGQWKIWCACGEFVPLVPVKLRRAHRRIIPETISIQFKFTLHSYCFDFPIHFFTGIKLRWFLRLHELSILG